ncbi:MAG: hypothetical protein DRI61_12400, partial [Chloroflexi bacterium]
TLNAGCEYILNAWPGIVKRTLADLSGQFTAGELSLIIDVFNGTALTPGLAGQHIAINVADSIDLDHTDQKWSVDKKTILKKLQNLTIFQAAVLEIWANGFWYGKNQPEKQNLKKYIRELAQ